MYQTGIAKERAMRENYTADELGRMITDFYGYLKENDSVNLQYKKKFIDIIKGFNAFERRYLLTLYYTIYLEGQLESSRVREVHHRSDTVN